jgi:hypothetical protein
VNALLRNPCLKLGSSKKSPCLLESFSSSEVNRQLYLQLWELYGSKFATNSDVVSAEPNSSRMVKLAQSWRDHSLFLVCLK